MNVGQFTGSETFYPKVPKTNIVDFSTTALCAYSGRQPETAFIITGAVAEEINFSRSFVKATLVSVSDPINAVHIGRSGQATIIAANSDYGTYVGHSVDSGAWTIISGGSIDGQCRLDYHVEFIVPCQLLEICGEWSACVGSQQSRVCDDGCGSVTTRTQSCTSDVPAPPPPPNILIQILQAVINAIKQFLAGLGITFTVVSPQTVVVNTPLTTTVSLSVAAPPDSDYSDGTASKYYGIVYVLDKSGNVLFNTEPAELSTNSYSHTFTYMPVQKGDIVVGGAILETKTVFNFATLQWGSWSQPQIVADDKKVVTVTGVTTAPPQPSFDIGAILQNIISTIQQWFCSTLKVFC